MHGTNCILLTTLFSRFGSSEQPLLHCQGWHGLKCVGERASWPSKGGVVESEQPTVLSHRHASAPEIHSPARSFHESGA